MIYEDEIFEAITDNNLDKVKEIILWDNVTKNDLVEYCDAACSLNQVDIVKFFLEEKHVILNYFPLLMAIFNNHTQLVKLLINREEIDITEDCTGLLYPYQKNKKEIMAILYSDKRVKEKLKTLSVKNKNKKEQYQAYKKAYIEYNVNSF